MVESRPGVATKFGECCTVRCAYGAVGVPSKELVAGVAAVYHFSSENRAK